MKCKEVTQPLLRLSSAPSGPKIPSWTTAVLLYSDVKSHHGHQLMSNFMVQHNGTGSCHGWPRLHWPQSHIETDERGVYFVHNIDNFSLGHTYFDSFLSKDQKDRVKNYRADINERTLSKKS